MDQNKDREDPPRTKLPHEVGGGGWGWRYLQEHKGIIHVHQPTRKWGRERWVLRYINDFTDAPHKWFKEWQESQTKLVRATEFASLAVLTFLFSGPLAGSSGPTPPEENIKPPAAAAKAVAYEHPSGYALTREAAYEPPRLKPTSRAETPSTPAVEAPPKKESTAKIGLDQFLFSEGYTPASLESVREEAENFLRSDHFGQQRYNKIDIYHSLIRLIVADPKLNIHPADQENFAKLIKTVVWVEMGDDPAANNSDYVGLMQINKKTLSEQAKKLGVVNPNPYSLWDSTLFAAYYLKNLRESNPGDLLFTAYNIGPNLVNNAKAAYLAESGKNASHPVTTRDLENSPAAREIFKRANVDPKEIGAHSRRAMTGLWYIDPEAFQKLFKSKLWG